MNHATPRHRADDRRSPRLLSRRNVTAAAISGMLLTGGAVAATSVVGASSQVAVAQTSGSSQGEPPASARAADERVVSRSSERSGLATLDEVATAAADQVDQTAENAEKSRDRAAAEAKKQKKADAEKKAKDEAADAKRRSLEEARANPRGVAKAMMGDFGWDASQFSCLDSLWAGESGWKHTATNASSGAYGIPQSLPGSKMASAGADWQTNPTTQIRWGLGYIRDVYGTPCSANAFKSGNGWY